MATKITGTVSGEPIIEYEVGGVFVPWKQGIQNWATVTAVTGSPASGSYTDADGVERTYYKWTGSGSVTMTEGIADVLVVGGGAGGAYGYGTVGGGAGGVRFGTFVLPAGSLSVTVGAGGSQASATSALGGDSSLGNVLKASGGGHAGSNTSTQWGGQGGGGSSGGLSSYAPAAFNRNGGGAGGTLYGSQAYSGITLNFTGSDYEYGIGGSSGSAGNYGSGGYGNQAGTAGVVIIRVPSTFAQA
jgi:hypothetical protein